MRYTKQKVKETLMVPEEVMREHRHAWLADTVGKYPSDIVFVEAPDYVFEGWGYDSTKVGYDRFIQPTPPEGWKYNTETGGFELINPPKEEPKPADRVTVLEAKVDALETQDSTLEECIVEIANVVYA